MSIAGRLYQIAHSACGGPTRMGTDVPHAPARVVCLFEQTAQSTRALFLNCLT